MYDNVGGVANYYVHQNVPPGERFLKTLLLLKSTQLILSEGMQYIPTEAML